jgi:P27 family predicted phage terminase small subunit
MGTRGRRPKPTAIKRLEGNPGKRRLNESEPAPDAADVRVPKGKLPPEGRALWRALAPQLADLGVLKTTDLPALEVLCLHYALVRRAWKILDEEGPTVENSRLVDDADPGAGVVVLTVKKHPAASVFRENAMAFKGFATEFGLTPSSRVRIKADPVTKEKTLAELLFESANAEGSDGG